MSTPVATSLITNTPVATSLITTTPVATTRITTTPVATKTDVVKEKKPVLNIGALIGIIIFYLIYRSLKARYNLIFVNR
jgi:hypothetical protein